MFSVVDIRYNLSVLHRMFLKFKKFLFIFDQYFPSVSDFHVSMFWKYPINLRTFGDGLVPSSVMFPGVNNDQIYDTLLRQLNQI